MKQFDQKLQEYQKEVSILNEVDTSTVGRFFGSLVQATPFRQGRPAWTPKYNPQNVYFLINGFKNLPLLKKVLPSGTPSKDEMFDYSNGQITNERKLAVQLYNAFDNAISIGQNYITLDQILKGEIYTGAGQKRRFTGTIRKEPNKEKIHLQLLSYLKYKKLDQIIVYMTPEQAKEAEKGGFWKQIGTGLSKGIYQGAKDTLGKIWQQATTSQNQGGGGALNI